MLRLPVLCVPLCGRSDFFLCFWSGSIWWESKNPGIHATVDAARIVLDDSKRVARYRHAFDTLREEVAGGGLFQDYHICLTRKELNWAPTANEAFFLAEMRMQP